MTKQEIRNIINKGWADRRERQRVRDELNSKRTAEWTARQENPLEEKNLRRWRHYLGIDKKNKKEKK
jgi:hypothetical protein